MTDYAELRAIIESRRQVKPARRRSTLPPKTRQQLRDKAVSARELGVCIHCDFMLMERPDGRLGNSEIVGMHGGSYSLRCSGPNGHELDPARTTFAGRQYLNPSPDGSAECLDPPF